MADSQVRYLQEMGPNLMKIIKRLLNNKELLKLLYYTDKDPLAENKPEVSIKEAYKDGDNGIIRIVPIISDKDNAQSIITLRVLKGNPVSSNNEYLDIYFSVEVFVPNTQWIIKSENLRPFAIMGEVQKSLDNKRINGLGTISGNGFSVNFFTEDISSFIMNYSITQFN